MTNERFDAEFRTRNVWNHRLGDGLMRLQRNGEWSGLDVIAHPTRSGKGYRSAMTPDDMACLIGVLTDELALMLKERQR